MKLIGRTRDCGVGPTQVWDITAPERPVRAATLPETTSDSPWRSTRRTRPSSSVRVGDNTTKVYDLADPYHPKVVDDLAAIAAKAAAFPNGDALAVAQDSFMELWNTTRR